MKAKRVVIYARAINKTGAIQQLAKVRVLAGRQRWAVTAEYVDYDIDKSKGPEQRPQLKALLEAVARRECDVIAVRSIHRLGRSLQDLAKILGEIRRNKVDLYLQEERINTMTAAGKTLFHMCGVFAKLERALIVERINLGLERVRKYGTRSGKPVGRPTGSANAKSRNHRLRQKAKDGIPGAR